MSRQSSSSAAGPLNAAGSDGKQGMQILIAGLAKTGTTGVYFLVKSSLLALTTIRKLVLMFEPRECPPWAFDGDAVTLAKIVLGPDGNARSFAAFNKKIVLVRDPRDRVISALLYAQYHAPYLGNPRSVERVLEALRKKEHHPRQISLLGIVDVIGVVGGAGAGRESLAADIRSDLAQFDRYVRETPDALLYKYEQFVQGSYGPLEQFLGLPITGNADVPLNRHRVVRTKSHGDWRNWMTPEDVAFFRPIFERSLEQYGYDPTDWTLASDPVIAPEHCSEYVLRLISEARPELSSNTARPG